MSEASASVSVHLNLTDGNLNSAQPVSIQFHKKEYTLPAINAEEGVIDANVTTLENDVLDKLKKSFNIKQAGGSLEKGGKSRKSRKMRRRRRKRGKKTQHKR
jgi:hypothetical protein